MTIGKTILAAFAPEEQLTGFQICKRTGIPVARVATYMSRLRMLGQVELINPHQRPALHQLTATARLQAQMRLGIIPAPDDEDNEPTVSRAMRTQPVSVFQLGRFL